MLMKNERERSHQYYGCRNSDTNLKQFVQLQSSLESSAVTCDRTAHGALNIAHVLYMKLQTV